MSGKFISLHNHTELGSPLDGMNDVKDLFVRAREVGHPGVAVTDHGTMTALYDAYKASQETGVKLIPGMEAYFSDDESEKKSYHLVLLAKNETGYRNLLKLNYWSYQNQVSGFMGKKTPRISWRHIEEANEGVIALTACSNGLIAKSLITNQEIALAEQHMKRLHHIFKDRFFLELQPHALQAIQKDGKEVNQIKLNEAMLKYSHDYGIPYVITCDAHYRDQDHAKYHDFMLAIKDKKAVDDPDRFRYGVQDMYLKTEDEITSFFGKRVADIGMANTMKIFNLCEEPSYIKPKGAVLPIFPVNQESDYQDFLTWKANTKSTSAMSEDKAYLRYKCIEGFKKKLAHLDKEKKEEYWDRVARGCFLPGSTVILSDGSSKNIEEINVGDSVISHDGTYNLVSNCLTYSVDEELVELEFEDGRTIRCTKDHEIFTNNRGWIAASEITEEDDVASVC